MYQRSRLAIAVLVLAVLAAEVHTAPHYGDSLRMVILMFRHGGRSPISSYPNDPYLNYPWVSGFGALQPVGTQQTYQLGKNLRERYESLIPSDGYYTTQKITATSSSVERAIMSAQSVLAAFLKPSGNAIDISIRWQPVPIFTIPTNDDYILQQTRPCNKYNQELGRLMVSPPAEYQSFFAELAQEYDYLSKNTGSTINSWMSVLGIYDTLIAEDRSGLKLPEWTSRVFPEKAEKGMGGAFRMMSGTPTMKLLKGGATFTEFLKLMKAKKSKTMSPDRSIFIYSGHDLTQVALMDSMGMLDQTTDRPEYASTVAFELHENSYLPGDLEVRMVYFKNWTVKVPQSLTIPGCPSPCAVSKLEESMRAIILDNYDAACAV
ncbi:lysosomal acid phosphatase-like [Uranotaenia lowii]|uniref:lysosomal acid phosphatase-like n=1 Tax=Uranotaenia lowii TaxID=190385 RepID=UPI0024797114|nr:lysosomal acid phosphatase-like [Uranotaenia lowii]